MNKTLIHFLSSPVGVGIVLIVFIVVILLLIRAVHRAFQIAADEADKHHALVEQWSNTLIRPNDGGGWGILIGKTVVGDFDTPEEANEVLRNHEIRPISQDVYAEMRANVLTCVPAGEHVKCSFYQIAKKAEQEFGYHSRSVSRSIHMLKDNCAIFTDGVNYWRAE